VTHYADDAQFIEKAKRALYVKAREELLKYEPPEGMSDRPKERRSAEHVGPERSPAGSVDLL
jgi:hypothetical protein